MRVFRSLAAWTATATTVIALAAPVAQGQQNSAPKAPTPRDSATVLPGSYASPPLGRTVLGEGWRTLWATPVKAPVLDLATYDGGLKVDKRGGGFQTITLHLEAQDGWREYRFRSVDKFPMRRLPPSMDGTFASRLIQDQTAALFPAAPLLAPPFLEAIGGLHVVPSLYVMPDDPRLGEHRATFAGMLGTFELKGEEAPDDKPGFAGSRKVKETDEFWEELYESQGNRVNEREMLAVRLVDFLINDGDRTPDNFDWARFGEEGAYLWRPIARDRDRAFTDARGLLNQYIVRPFLYPKFTEFGPRYSLKGLMQSSYVFDRRLLQRLTAPDFAAVAHDVQRAVDDSVIEAAIAALPAEWRAQTEEMERIRVTLKARRALLPDVAQRLYAELARETDVRLTGDDERAEILRHADGSVTVTVPLLPRPVVVASAETLVSGGGAVRTMGGEIDLGPGAPFYRRTFLPGETREVRIYLGRGNDVAVVRGAPNDDIIVRVVGDSGADVLADSAGGGGTHLYDADQGTQFLASSETHVSMTPWVAPKDVFGYAPGAAWRPDWGSRTGWRPVVKHKQGAGLILGAGPRIKQYGFRRLPHWWEADAAFLVGTGNGRVGLTVDAEYRMENSPVAITLAARASQLEAFRFYGYGNDTPEVDSDVTLVEQNMFVAEPAWVWHLGWRAREHSFNLLAQDSADTRRMVRPTIGRLYAGPVLSWTDPQPIAGAPLLAPDVDGGDSFGLAGGRVGVELEATDHDALPTRGWNLRGNVAAYPLVPGLTRSFGTATGMAATYLPLGNAGAHLAFRAGGTVASGDFPAQYAARIGGSSTVRGYRSGRYTGDAAASGTTELRVPVGTMNFIVRSQVGVFGLADAGRVWFDGKSEGGWHTGVGGGIWVSALGRLLSVSYAKGENHRFYLKSGLGF